MVSRVGKVCLLSQRGVRGVGHSFESEKCVHMWIRNWLFLGRVFWQGACEELLGFELW